MGTGEATRSMKKNDKFIMRDKSPTSDQRSGSIWSTCAKARTVLRHVCGTRNQTSPNSDDCLTCVLCAHVYVTEERDPPPSVLVVLLPVTIKNQTNIGRDISYYYKSINLDTRKRPIQS